eukprot:1682883-Rhodomonas_salina.1
MGAEMVKEEEEEEEEEDEEEDPSEAPLAGQGGGGGGLREERQGAQHVTLSADHVIQGAEPRYPAPPAQDGRPRAGPDSAFQVGGGPGSASGLQTGGGPGSAS